MRENSHARYNEDYTSIVKKIDSVFGEERPAG